MQIDSEILEKLERLSHLYIEENKKEEMIRQLNGIVSYVENLNELDTDALDSYFSTLEGGTPMRNDLPEHNPETAEIILKHAPDSRDDFFIVPAIIE